MKRNAIMVLALVGALTLGAGSASAETFVFVPDPADLDDLTHGKWYTWGIDVSELAGMTITEIELTIDDITNWDSNDNVLFIHLLDDAALGVESDQDGQDWVDEFDGDGPLVDEWHDENGSQQTDDLQYLFSALGLLAIAEAFCADGTIGFGFDPDCHFWNAGVTVTITTEHPSPAEKLSWGQLKNRYR